MFEILNGIMMRADREEFLEKTAFGFLPGGTSSTLLNICKRKGEVFSPEAGAYFIAKG